MILKDILLILRQETATTPVQAWSHLLAMQITLPPLFHCHYSLYGKELLNQNQQV